MLVGLDEVNGGGVVSSVHINTEPAARGTTSGASAVSLVGGQPSPRHGLRPGNQPPPRPPAPPAMRGAGFSKRHGKAYWLSSLPRSIELHKIERCSRPKSQKGFVRTVHRGRGWNDRTQGVGGRGTPGL